MKTTFTKTVSGSIASIIAHQGITAVMEEWTWKNTCLGIDWAIYGNNYQRNWPHDLDRPDPGHFWVSPDWTGYQVGFKLSDRGRTVELYESTCGGHYHSLLVNTINGRLTVTHEGSRKSFPGCFPLPGDSPFWELNECLEWTLTEYKTSEPTWAAVAGLLRGKVGTGPTNREEVDLMESELHEKKVRSVFKLIAKDFPEGVAYSVNWGWYNTSSFKEVTIPKWDSVDWRRAGAIGVKLMNLKNLKGGA